jgi:hypothetical protein
MAAVAGRSTGSLAVMRNIASFSLSVLMSCSVAHAEDACGGSDAKYYDEGLMFHLARAGVPYRKVDGGGLCVEARYATQLKSAERELDRYFYEIAHNPRDPCEERALVEWARRERLRFVLAPSRNSRNEPAGNLFLVRSFTYEEMVTNRDTFDRSAPKGAKCQ